MIAVEYSYGAKRDLRGIWDYTFATWSRAQADKYYQSIVNACNKVARIQALGRKYEQVSERYLGYKQGRHVIIFRSLAPGEIFVVRILHQSMNFGNWIEDEK